DPTQLGDLLATTYIYQNYALLLTARKRREDALPLLERNRALALALQIGVNQANLARFFTSEESAQINALKAEAVSTARTLAAVKALPVPREESEQKASSQRLTEAEAKAKAAFQ